MIITKYILLILILIGSSGIGMLISKKYKNRVIELKQFKETINILETKIKFTYEPLAEIFNQISNMIEGNLVSIFKETSIKMKENSVKQAWNESIELYKNILSLNKEDIEIVKGLGKMIGQTDVDGQVSELEMVSNFIDTQIKKAEEECKKNEKLYRTLGTVVGLAIVIILV